MYKKLFGIATLAMLMLMIVPANAWVYPLSVGGKDVWDDHWENYGPRLDRIFVKMYNGQEPMWIALAAGAIDMTDWPLNLKWYTTFMTPTYCNKINVVTYPWKNSLAEAGERGSYLMYFNHNNYTTLGPPGPADPNPVYPCATAELSLRQAICYLLNRTWMETEVLKGMGITMYTAIAPYMEPLGWLNREIYPGRSLQDLCYLYDPEEANHLLTANGFKNGTDGWRYWDRNGNNVKDTGEDLTLIMWVRSDHEGRYKIGTRIAEELQKDPIKIHVELNYGGGGKCYVEVMLNKRYHMYTAGWIFIGPEPDYTYDLWHSSMYWHDPESSCPNTDRIEDPVLDADAEGVKFAATMAGANASVWAFQEQFALMAHELPLYCNFGVKAYSNTYVGDGPGTTGPEDQYEGEEWWGVINEQGFGVNSWWTFMSAHPSCHSIGDGEHMTMRYGWSSIWYPTHLNILYAEWYWDYECLNKIYDSLGMRNPNNLSKVEPWVAKSWEVGEWKDPIDGKWKSKIRLTLRDDVYWTDGKPLTAADVAFTFVECVKLLQSKKYATPWWYPAVQYIKSFTILDPCNIEILFDKKSAWVAIWTLIAVPVIPKHIWKPIILTGDPTAFQPDVNMIGSGPWKFVSFTEMESLVMSANYDYFRYCPKDVDVTTLLTFKNMDPIPPVLGSYWHMETPYYSYVFKLTQWGDTDHDGLLDQSDYVFLVPVGTPPPCFAAEGKLYHVFETEPVDHPEGPPGTVTLKVEWYAQKISIPHDEGKKPTQNWLYVTFGVEDHNKICEEFRFITLGAFDPTHPESGFLMGYWPPGIDGCEFHIDAWEDQNLDGIVDVCDVLTITSLADPGKPLFFHVHDMWFDGANWHFVLKEALFTHKIVTVVNKTGEYPVVDDYEWEKPCHPLKEEFTLNISKCTSRVIVTKIILNPWTLCKNNLIKPNPYYMYTKVIGWRVWMTIIEDVAGTTYYDVIGLPTYPYKDQLPCPDCRVDMSDIYDAAKGFGSYPGHARWKPHCDINKDNRIDMSDLYPMCKMFGKFV